MIWSSVILMTVIDVLIIFAAVCLVIIFIKHLVKTLSPRLSATTDIFEQKVQDHTSEIMAINVQLRQEIVERKQAEENLLNIAKGISANTGEEFFISMVEHLGRLLCVDYTFVGQLIEGKVERIRTIALYTDGEIIDNFEYDLADTACADVMAQSICIHTSGIQQKYPNDQLLKDMDIEGYAGAPLFDSEGKSLGIIVVLNRRPLAETATIKSILQIFSMRAAAELERKQAEQVLQLSEERLQLVMSVNNDGWYDWDVTTNSVYFDPRYYMMAGYEPNEFPGTYEEWAKRVHPEDWVETEKAVNAHQAGEIPEYDVEFRFMRKDGEWMWIRARIKVISRDKSGAPLRLVGTHTDITERKQAEAALRESEERFRGAFDQAINPMALIGLDGQVLKMNEAVRHLVGYSAEEVMEMGWEGLLHPEDLNDSKARMAKILTGEVDNYLTETRYIHKSGEVLWVSVTVSAICDDKGKPMHYIAMSRDITETRRLTDQLSFQASHDALTGLVNRREFEIRLKRVLDTARDKQTEHALCYLDLDQFKVINDTCGHVAGDELLRQLGSLLQKEIRKRDTLARLGGDEFGVLMEHCSLKQAKRVAKKLRKATEAFRFAWEDRSFAIGVSIGLVPITATCMNTIEILKQADAACYAAKDAGRNRIHVYSADDTELAHRHGEMQWVAQINRALEEDRFCLYMQTIKPLLAHADDTGEHYELLLRMRSDKGQLIPPGAFLPAAERYNLSTRLDRWVIDHAFRWLIDNPEHLERLSLCSINLSGLSLSDDEFLAYVVQQFRETIIPPEKICFEITETAAIANLSSAIVFIKKLKELGCQFALDDFGSGLSSFAYLKTLPVDYLKIDGMFVKGIETDPIDLAMVKSINDIGKVMGKRTIAEFVESEAILVKLKEIGVDYAQGFHLGKPHAIGEETPIAVKARVSKVTPENKG